MLKIQKINEITPFTQGLNALKLFSDSTLEILHITLSIGERIDTHKNNIDVVFYVLSGKGTLIVGLENHEIEAGSCVEVLKDLDRSWENSGSDPLCLMAIKRL